MSILPTLSGRWFLSRSIDDGSSMTGLATFTPTAAGQFDYCERGKLQLLAGPTLDAERRYVFEETPGGFAVFFPETPLRLFHRIALQATGPSLVGAAAHFCGDDRYDSRYEFRADGCFTVRHAVTGPHKRYTIVTRYTRAPVEVALTAPPA